MDDGKVKEKYRPVDLEDKHRSPSEVASWTTADHAANHDSLAKARKQKLKLYEPSNNVEEEDREG